MARLIQQPKLSFLLSLGIQWVRLHLDDLPTIETTTIEITSQLARVLDVDRIFCPNGHAHLVVDAERLPRTIDTVIDSRETYWCEGCREEHEDVESHYRCSHCYATITVPWREASNYTRHVPGMTSVTPMKVEPRPFDRGWIEPNKPYPLQAHLIVQPNGRSRKIPEPISMGDWALVDYEMSSQAGMVWFLTPTSDPTSGMHRLAEEVARA